MSHLIQDWRPEDPEFWQSTGRKIARRNLWISIPALFLAFAHVAGMERNHSKPTQYRL